MATYRLVWSGDGALDLSQVLDTRGRPIVLSPRERMVSVSESTLKNPYVQRYLDTPLLKAELLDGPKPVMSPPAPPPAPPAPPPVKTAPVVPVAPTKNVVVADEVMTKDTAKVTALDAEPLSSSTTPSPPDTDTGTELKGGFKGRKGTRR